MGKRAAKMISTSTRGMGKLASVTLNDETLVTEWFGVEIGKRFQIDNGGQFWFVASKIEPTFEGSEYAWVTGKRVNTRNRAVDQITHQHCGEGERMELVHRSMLVKAVRKTAGVSAEAHPSVEQLMVERPAAKLVAQFLEDPFGFSGSVSAIEEAKARFAK